jgi:hypothetical protein
VPTYVDTAQDRQEQRDKQKQVQERDKYVSESGSKPSGHPGRETKKESSSQITRQTKPTGHQR